MNTGALSYLVLCGLTNHQNLSLCKVYDEMGEAANQHWHKAPYKAKDSPDFVVFANRQLLSAGAVKGDTPF